MTDVRETILKELEDGRGLASICRDDGMPDRRTVQRWQDDDAEFDAAVTRAREHGYQHRGEKAVEDAKTCEDPAKGRLAFDAERWYLGKLSNAFTDKQRHEHDVNLKVDWADRAQQARQRAD